MYVIRTIDGKYLKKTSSRSSATTRTFVDSIEGATVWNKLGAAKNAAYYTREMVTVWEVKITLGEYFWIKE